MILTCIDVWVKVKDLSSFPFDLWTEGRPVTKVQRQDGVTSSRGEGNFICSCLQKVKTTNELDEEDEDSMGIFIPVFDKDGVPVVWPSRVETNNSTIIVEKI